MKAGYLQFEPEFGNTEVNIRKISRLIEREDFDLLVLPELANSGYLFSSADELNKYSEEIPNGEFCKSLQSICAQKNAYIVSGICEKHGEEFYNSSILVRPDGKIITYRKIHLFYNEKNWFKPGNIYLQAEEISGRFGALKIGMMVCYDWIYPETARTLAMKGAQIICHPSNLVMPYCQNSMFTRAVENRVFTITANRIGKEKNNGTELEFTGKSVILSPKGEYLSTASVNKEECNIIEIDPGEALDKNMNPNNNLFDDRREEYYYT